MQAGSCDRARDRLAAIGMPRHDHAQQRWKESGERPVRFEQDLFFAGMGRGRDDDRAAARHRHQPFQLGGSAGRRRNIELQIARGDDVAAAERRKAFRIDLRLRQADLEPAEQRRDGAAQPCASAETSAATSGR